MKSKLLYACILSASLFGCAQVPEQHAALPSSAAAPSSPAADVQTLRDLAEVDLVRAIAISSANGDQVAVACFSALKKDLANLVPSAGLEPVGLVSTYAKGRGLHRKLEGGVSEEVHQACAVLVVDAQGFLMRLMRLFR